jgi:plasmid maintenance system antidote protein VapI
MNKQCLIKNIKIKGNSPEFWLNAQRACDLWQAEQACGQEINKIKPLRAA